jgi:tetratricopeptide (TPR) repeat protein
MIMERHYDDAALIHLMESGRPDDPHVASCRQCADSLASYRAIREVLGEDAVWDLRELNDEPVPQTIATLRAFATDMAREDAEADAILPRLLAGPRESWLPRLARHPEWRTAGVVRRLIAALDRALDTMPPDAVEITGLATEIADHLEPTQYPSETVLKLRGAAWRERGYALDYTGDYAAALRAVLRAEDNLVTVQVGDYDTARLHLVAARVFRNLDRTSEALARTARAAELFAVAGDHRRQTFARFTQGMIEYRVRDMRGALTTFRALEPEYGEDKHTLAMLLQNIGQVERELGNFEAASETFLRAMDLFAELNVSTEALRARWSAAKMSMAHGDVVGAIRQLYIVRDELERKGMEGERVLISLDLAEALILLGDRMEGTRICREVISYLDQAEQTQTFTNATALGLLREATMRDAVTPRVIVETRQQVRRRPASEGLRLFAAAPDF